MKKRRFRLEWLLAAVNTLSRLGFQAITFAVAFFALAVNADTQKDGSAEPFSYELVAHDQGGGECEYLYELNWCFQNPFL